jgi:serine/threonine-protein kinase
MIEAMYFARDPVLPKPGDVVGGRYAIDARLGKGATSVVYRATDRKRGRRVALKVLQPDAAAVPEVQHRLKREARAVMQLQGPHVAHVLEVDETPDGLPYLVMELLEGKDLSEEMHARKGVFSVAEAVALVLEACSAIGEAHAHGIVHRDLKPANLFLCNAGRRRTLKVLDFGVSKVDAISTTNVTKTEMVLGTPVYMSPEQIDSAKTVDARADIWALGVILYELLACELPFRGGEMTGILTSIMADPPKPLAPRRPDAPPELVDVVMKALAKDPKARYATVGELAAALTPFAPVASAGRWSRRRWAWVAVGAAVIALGMVALSVLAGGR